MTTRRNTGLAAGTFAALLAGAAVFASLGGSAPALKAGDVHAASIEVTGSATIGTGLTVGGEQVVATPPCSAAQVPVWSGIAWGCGSASGGGSSGSATCPSGWMTAIAGSSATCSTPTASQVGALSGTGTANHVVVYNGTSTVAASSNITDTGTACAIAEPTTITGAVAIRNSSGTSTYSTAPSTGGADITTIDVSGATGSAATQTILWGSLSNTLTPTHWEFEDRADNVMALDIHVNDGANDALTVGTAIDEEISKTPGGNGVPAYRLTDSRSGSASPSNEWCGIDVNEEATYAVPSGQNAGTYGIIGACRTVNTGSGGLQCIGVAATAAGSGVSANIAFMGFNGEWLVGNGDPTAGIYFHSPTGANISSGPGAPSGSACTPATSGSIWMRTDGGAGTSLYVCEAGTWTAK